MFIITVYIKKLAVHKHQTNDFYFKYIVLLLCRLLINSLRQANQLQALLVTVC